VIIKHGTEYSDGTGLTVDSAIRLHKIVTIPKYLIKRKLGTIGKTLEVEVKEKIRHLFDQE
jgi:mRNA interferase MazF